MAQAQLFRKGDKLHLGFVLVGALCHLEELPRGGSMVSIKPPPVILGLATPSPSPSAPPKQAKPVPTPIKT